MENHVMEREKENLGDKKWNNLMNDRLDHKEFNEGFSAENISPDYDPSKDASENFRDEIDIDENGNPDHVKRARFVDDDAMDKASDVAIPVDNRIIENQDSLKNRDRNYDTDPNRYPPSHPDNQIHRGNNPEE